MKIPAKHKPPVFDIPASVWKTISFDEIQDTFADMYETDLVYPPFDHFCVRCPLGAFIEATSEHIRKRDKEFFKGGLEAMPNWVKKSAHLPIVVEYQFRQVPKDSKNTVGYQYRGFMSLGEGDLALPWDLLTNMPQDLSETMNGFIYKALVVLLVTKNCTRKIVENTPRSSAKKARDDSKHYSTTTYISIGRITETCRSKEGSRGPVRAHLRRGHVRRQRHGEGRQEVKTIFIPPVFVNADREWIDARKNYKLVA